MHPHRDHFDHDRRTCTPPCPQLRPFAKPLLREVSLGVDDHLAAVDRHVVAGNDSAAHGVDGFDAGGEDREGDLFDFADIADEAIDDSTAGTAGFRSSRKQFAPGRVAGGFLGADDGDFAGEEAIDGLNLQAIGIGRDVIDV